MFTTWFTQYPALSSVFTLLSAIDIQVLNTLSSELAGFKMFSAPFSQKANQLMFFGNIVHIMIGDIPQFIIQIFYSLNVVTYDLIPLLTLISGGLVLGNKLIMRSYYVLARFHRHKIRDSKHSSLQSNVEI